MYAAGGHKIWICVTAEPSKMTASVCKGENKVTKKRMNPKTRRIFLDGLRRYKERGVRILLDGKEVDIDRLEVIFEEQPDGSFYMGDYVLEDEEDLERRTAAVQERAERYGNEVTYIHAKNLREIRFDRVYNR